MGSLPKKEERRLIYSLRFVVWIMKVIGITDMCESDKTKRK